MIKSLVFALCLLLLPISASYAKDMAVAQGDSTTVTLTNEPCVKASPKMAKIMKKIQTPADIVKRSMYARIVYQGRTLDACYVDMDVFVSILDEDEDSGRILKELFKPVNGV